MSGASHVLSGQRSFEVPVGNAMAEQYYPEGHQCNAV